MFLKCRIRCIRHQNAELVTANSGHGVLRAHNLTEPAGHLEPGESLLAAVVRETHEETGHRFVPAALVGIYRWVHPGSGETMLRLCFCGDIAGQVPQYPLDADIIDTHWLTPAELDSGRHRMRSPLVRRCLDDYRAGQRAPLDLLAEL